MPEKFQVSITELNDYKNLLHELKQRWEAIEKEPGIFRYKLNVQKETILKGEFRFFIQVCSPSNAVFCY